MDASNLVDSAKTLAAQAADMAASAAELATDAALVVTQQAAPAVAIRSSLCSPCLCWRVSSVTSWCGA